MIHTLFSIGVVSASGSATTPVVTTHSTRAVTTSPPGALGRGQSPAPWGPSPAVPWNSPFPDAALYSSGPRRACGSNRQVFPYRGVCADLQELMARRRRRGIVAETLTRAAFEVLADRISGGETQELAEPLKSWLRTDEEIAKGYGAHSFVRRVADRANVPRELAEAGIHAVLATLREAVGEQEFRDATAQLPREYDTLLSHPRARPAPGNDLFLRQPRRCRDRLSATVDTGSPRTDRSRPCGPWSPVRPAADMDRGRGHLERGNGLDPSSSIPRRRSPARSPRPVTDYTDFSHLERADQVVAAMPGGGWRAAWSGVKQPAPGAPLTA
ncbi:DUF2267 domain-containing protein [Streptomyces sp. WAC04114]|uniref:DUF2267 domain-containing protein n=1 Tax=Streptomyces sp. WAC04114 TaxID=2867961 RepID=UPI0035ABC3E8